MSANYRVKLPLYRNNMELKLNEVTDSHLGSFLYYFGQCTVVIRYNTVSSCVVLFLVVQVIKLLLMPAVEILKL